MRTKEEEKAFRKARESFIGASDSGDLLNLPPYGCQRKMAMGKLGYEPDFDLGDKAEIRRGKRLEDIAVMYYMQKTLRTTRLATMVIDKEIPHLAVNMDRIVLDPKRGDKDPGYLEIKVVGRESFFKIKKEGLPEAYITQTQFGLAVAKFNWGSFGIYWPDGDELLYWDFEANKKLGESLREKGDDFFSFHIAGNILPEALPFGSPQCNGCQFAQQCPSGGYVAPAAGKDITPFPALLEVARSFCEFEAYDKEIEGGCEDLRAQIMDAVKSQAGKYDTGEHIIAISHASRSSIDSKRLAEEKPEIFKEYQTKSTFPRVAVKRKEQ